MEAAQYNVGGVVVSCGKCVGPHLVEVWFLREQPANEGRRGPAVEIGLLYHYGPSLVDCQPRVRPLMIVFRMRQGHEYRWQADGGEFGD